MENEIIEGMKNLNLNSENSNNENENSKQNKEENHIAKDNDDDFDDTIKINDELDKQQDKEEKRPKKLSLKQTEKMNIIPLKSKRTFKSDDFEIISLSGKGAYGSVLKATLKSDPSNKLYAIKVMDIKALTRIKKLYQAYLECDILFQINNPYIVDIKGSFIEHGKIYLVMEYLSKGDFSDFIRLNFPLKIVNIKLYAAEIVNFLEYLQSKKIVHRDLKPENIMMNEKWHIQVIDFGSARILGKYFDKEKMEFKEDDTYYDISETDDLKGNKIAINDEDDDFDFYESHKKPDRRGMTFVGTAEYVSPEVLGDKPAEFGADIWALGIMIYQMFFGKTPFKEKTNYLIFRKIEQLKIDFGDNENGVIPEEAIDLINKILVKDPSKRLGAGPPGSENDISHLKSHPFFKGIYWDNLHNTPVPNSKNFDSLLSQKKEMNEKKTMEENNNKTSQNNKSEEKEIILKEGELEKKTRWLHYNKRKVILYSTPKIIYIDTSINKVKGEIFLDKSVKVNHVNSNIFDIISPKRNYRFKTTDGEALVWEKYIADAIRQYNK